MRVSQKSPTNGLELRNNAVFVIPACDFSSRCWDRDCDCRERMLRKSRFENMASSVDVARILQTS